LADDRVPVVSPDGTLGSVPKDNYAKALQSGYRFQTPEEQEKYASQLKYGDRPGAAAGAGAARGLTLGLSDLALPATGLVKKETLRGLQEENPGASAAGDVGATAATLLIPGVGEETAPGLVAKVGRAIEGGIGATTRTGRLGARVAAGAAEGTLFGAGNAVSDAALGDPNLNAEKLISHVGLAAVLGSGSGLLSGAVSEAAREVLPKASTLATNAQDLLGDFANDRWLKAAGGIQTEIKKIPLDEHGAVADVMRQHLVEPGGLLPKDLKTALESVENERATVGQNVVGESGITDSGGLLPAHDQQEALEALDKARDIHGQRIGRVYEALDAAGARPDLDALQTRIGGMRQGLSLAERDAIEPQIQRLEEYVGELRTNPTDATFSKLNKLRSDLDKEIKPLWRAGDTFQGGLRKRLLHEMRDELDTQLARQAGPDATQELLSAKREFGALSRGEEALRGKKSTGLDAIRAIAGSNDMPKPSLARFNALEHARELLQRGVWREHGNRWLSASDYLTGIGAGVMHGNPVGALTGLGASLAHKFMRENGAAVVAGLADRLSKSPTLAAVAESFAKKLPTLNMGAYGSLMADKAAQSSAHALAEHMVRSQVDPQYASTAQLAGLEPEAPEQHSAAIERATGTATTAGALQAHDEALDKHMDAVFTGKRSPSEGSPAHGSQEFGAKGMRRTSVESHRQMVKEAAELASNPDALVERVANNAAALGDVAPSIVAALTEKARVAAEYLAREGASPPPKGPLAMPHVPSHAEMHAYAMKVEVVREPMSVLRYAADGMLTRAQVDALKTVYPMLAHDIADRALSKLTEGPKNVPYKARLMLSLLTGIDVDGTMSPAAIAANQKAIASAGVREQAQRNQPTKSQGEALHVAERESLPNQKRDMVQGEIA
jgi:hypothetical protein